MFSNITYWLDKTVKKYPDKIGYADEIQKLTFLQVYRKALNLAEKIVEQNCFKMPIAIYMEKSVDVLISFFAAAYSGNFYSPIDVDMPESRIKKILEILKPRIIITKRNLAETINALAPDAVVIFEDEVTDVSSGSYEKVFEQRDRTCDTDLLYVLFTSGSTGIPKGVTICHRAVMDYIDCIEDIFHITSDDSFGNQAPFYFDNSILDIYTTMKTGASMYIIPQKVFAWPIPLLKYLDENKINTIFWVPSAMLMIAKMKALKAYDMRGKLKRVLFCGEVMPNKTLNIWRKYLPDAVFANLYGPTEITDACTYYIADREFSDAEPLPIGRPMKNTDVLILNEKNEPVKDGESGELCVRGTSLSMGYYHNPEKTAEVFVQNPLNEAYPEIIYRTGDIVKYNEYGEIVYLSRKDFQVKHMGHRIELGEIETAVSSLDEVSGNCCLYDEKRSKIVLFLEENFPEEKIELEKINQQIKNLIPEYMLPNRIVYVDKMPLNANGKTDRKKLKELLE